MARVTIAAGTEADALGEGVTAHLLVPGDEDSALELTLVELVPGARTELDGATADVVVYAAAGSGSLELAGGRHRLGPGGAGILLAGESGVAVAGDDGLTLARFDVGPGADRHAPMGPRAVSVSPADATTEQATGSRSADVLADPHNGFVRATLFVGHIPPGRAPWHYHQYDEIVWIAGGSGRLHLEGGVEELERGAAFRLRPRELHVVENASPTEELTVVGLFTPAGSPTAAYLPA